MNEAFAWIGEIVQWFGQWVPRWVVLNSTQGAVKFVTLRVRDVVRFRWDTSVKEHVIGPGLVFYWPAVTELKDWIVARQSVNLTTQTLTTKDGKVIAVGAVMVFRVLDVLPLIAHTFDPDATIRAVSAGVVQRVVSQASWEELQRVKDEGLLDHHLKRGLNKALRRRFGVQVLDATLTDFAPCRVLKVIQSTSSDTQ
jgi:regulator of protease activity HflC (stomatin/prohibitin superfamily)